MMDRERIPSKLDELDSYLGELEKIAPRNLDEYVSSVEKRRACEKLLDISIEFVIDACNLLVSGMRLGLPGGEGDLFVKLERAGAISSELGDTPKRMRAFRNILVQRYGRVDDKSVYHAI